MYFIVSSNRKIKTRSSTNIKEDRVKRLRSKKLYIENKKKIQELLSDRCRRTR